MNNNIDIFAAFSGLLELNAALLGVTVTLVALVPTLVELIRLKYPSFFSSEVARRRLNKGLVELGRSIWLFGATTLLSIIGLVVWQHIMLLIVVTILSMLGIALIVKVGYFIASITTSVT